MQKGKLGKTDSKQEYRKTSTLVIFSRKSAKTKKTLKAEL